MENKVPPTTESTEAPMQADSTVYQGSEFSESPQAGGQSSSMPRSSAKASGQNVDPTASKSDQNSNLQADARQAKLQASISTLKSNITSTESQVSTKLEEIAQLKSFQTQRQPGTDQDSNKITLAHAQSIINRHISLLKRYNEIKDIAMAMLDLIAEKERKRLVEVMEERGISEKD